VIQSVRPVKVLLSYGRKTAAYLSDDDKPPLPFPASDVVLVLDPYFPQDLDARFAEEIPDLIAQGFTRFVVNNPAHFAFFRGTNAALIAGPYLYAFNRFSAAFVADFGADFFVSPLENNRQNLEKTFDPPRRPAVFVTIFAYPALFRIRDNLGPLYPFSKFSDSQGATFSLLTDIDGSTVIPEDPFSIVDKVPFLREAGFKRFIVDFSGPPLKKKPYKDVMSAVQSGAPLPGITRFNWKDGFYQDNQ
jgi:putative protease